MHDEGFQNKRDTRHRSLNSVWSSFLTSDGSEIKPSVEDFRPIN